LAPEGLLYTESFIKIRAVETLTLINPEPRRVDRTLFLEVILSDEKQTKEFNALQQKSV
jgi:hypothetical protein